MIKKIQGQQFQVKPQPISNFSSQNYRDSYNDSAKACNISGNNTTTNQSNKNIEMYS